jgi:hypothetical protein
VDSAFSSAQGVLKKQFANISTFRSKRYRYVFGLALFTVWHGPPPPSMDLINFGPPSGSTTAQPAASDNNDQVMLDAAPPRPDLGLVYKQCKTARAAANTVYTTRFGPDQGFTCDEPAAEKIGNLDCPGDSEVKKTFHGARLGKGAKTVNECLSMSFDPRSFICWGCSSNHSVLDVAPLTICFTDQNFPPFIQDSNANCLGIVRMEDASLPELVELCFELFAGTNIPPGSVSQKSV